MGARRSDAGGGVNACVFCRRPVDPVYGLMVYDAIDLRTPRLWLCSWRCCARWSEILAGELEPARPVTPAATQSALF
jgi:hypothetical protein